MQTPNDKGADRLIQMLATALGEVGDLLLDETIVELMLNPEEVLLTASDFEPAVSSETPDHEQQPGA